MYASAAMALPCNHLAAFTWSRRLAVEVAMVQAAVVVAQARRLLRTDFIFGRVRDRGGCGECCASLFFEKGREY